ncbi:hypothetical protein ABZ330_36065 [Streptomyces sp. NPDC006172]|uniref:hypothetical protein n=1 Tax=Streptomyces sp. NPDC006172 TaxID=3154470 RepID=UPI00340F61CD
MKKARRDLKPATTAALAAVLAFAAGCSTGEQNREYAIPESLCGTAVDANDLESFLPAGRKITVREKEYSGSKICEVVVDDTLIATASRIWLKEGTTTMNFAYGQTTHTPESSAEEGRFRYSENEAFGRTRNCLDPRGKQVLYTAIQAQGSKHRDAEAMKRLIISFTAVVEKSTECTTG